MLCPACGTQNRVGNAYCSQCGAALAPSSHQATSTAYCRACGAPLRAGNAFCSQCGAPLAPSSLSTQPPSAAEPLRSAPITRPPPASPVVPLVDAWRASAPFRAASQAPPTPPFVPPPAPLPMPVNAPAYAGAPDVRVRRRHGCLRAGCLVVGIAFLVVLALVGWVYARQSGLIARAGLAQPPEQRLLGGRPNAVAAAALKAQLLAGGFSDAGLNVVVMPVTGKGYSLAVAVMDVSQGFHAEASSDVLLDCIKLLGTSDAATQYAIARVAVHFYDETGHKVVSLTAATPDIQAYAAGQITRDEFLQAMEGRVERETPTKEAP